MNYIEAFNVISNAGKFPVEIVPDPQEPERKIKIGWARDIKEAREILFNFMGKYIVTMNEDGEYKIMEKKGWVN